MRFILVLLVFLICATPAFAGFTRTNNKADPITGLWITEDKDAAVDLYECGKQICGRFHWLKIETSDSHNRDVTKRGKPLCHLQFIGGFTRDKDGDYNGGWVYNPQDGSTYDAEMSLVDANTLHIHGYVMLPLFGESQTWMRAKSMAACQTGLK